MGNQPKLETGAIQDCIHRLEPCGIESLLVRLSGHHDDHQSVESGVLAHYRDEFFAPDPRDANIDNDGPNAILTDRARCADGRRLLEHHETLGTQDPKEAFPHPLGIGDHEYTLVRFRPRTAGAHWFVSGDQRWLLDVHWTGLSVLMIAREVILGIGSPNADPPTSMVDLDALGQTTDKSARLLDGKIFRIGSRSECGGRGGDGCFASHSGCSEPLNKGHVKQLQRCCISCVPVGPIKAKRW